MQVAVIIPFFQRTPGLLLQAVCSALAQADAEPFVIVVDDGSPVDARAELAGLGSDAVLVVEQANAGPAAARNCGLDHVPSHIEFAAFLDSDDTWHPGHLRNALAAFTAGADFFFSDWRRPDEAASRFGLPHVIRPQGDPLPCGEDLFRSRGDLFDAILRCSPVGTSGVVYRRAISPALRFEADLRAGEDNLFWMALARCARSTAFTTRCEAFYGKGENISASRWRDPRALTHLEHAARMHRRVARIHRLTSAQKAWNDTWRAELRSSYASNLLAMARHREAVDWRGVGAFAREEPRLLLSLAQAAITAIATRTLTRNRSS